MTLASSALLGIPGTWVRTPRPQSECWTAQVFHSEWRPLPDAPNERVQVTVRFDDQCTNGHNTLSITGVVRELGQRDEVAAGQCVKEINAAFPELAPLMPWHLVSTDGPLHYIANTVYHAQNGAFDYARSTAVWPEATDADLASPNLGDVLQHRLPHLQATFQRLVEEAGFGFDARTYTPSVPAVTPTARRPSPGR
jgi:hypothetical protein